MIKTLHKYFPMLRTREEVLEEIGSSPRLQQIFQSWKETQREQFLDYVTGAKGVKILYDSFFKEVMNPETVPERLERFLSLVLEQNVKIKTVLPNDNNRIADESSLLIMDILIELEDESLADIEVQKIGYRFPGQRCACYSADLLLRQYKRIRSERKEKFSYKDIKKVYTLVLFEKSSKEFHQYPDRYLHRLRQQSDTGLYVELLQEYFLIPLDIFHTNLQNEGIRNELDAWLTFLCVEEPEMIIQLIQRYPQFMPMYQQVYEICRNIEKVMGLYSEELKILDRNTVQLMIDEMQEEMDGQKEQLKKSEKQLFQMGEELHQKDKELSQKNKQLEEKEQEIQNLRKQLVQQGVVL